MKFIFLLLLTALSVFGAEKVIFSETFTKPDALKAWRQILKKDGAVFTVAPDGLHVNHKHLKNGGGFIEIPVPLIKKGRLDFDVEVVLKQGQRPGIGLMVELYNISTFFHDGCRDWRMYFPEANVKRLPYFNIEPVGHHKISSVARNKKIHYRIRFDEESDLVEFYAGDMKDPATARYDVSVFGHAFYRGGYLRIGSFGYAPSDYYSRITNLTLTEEDNTVNHTAVRDQILVFEGMGSDHYVMKKLFSRETKNIRSYRWESSGACPGNFNNCQYFKMPGFATLDNAKYIIFNDAPNVQKTLQKKMLEAVSNGAHLIIMGGLFTLGNGDFVNTPIGDALPVKVDKKWNLAGDSKTPLAISGTKNKGILYYYFPAELTPGAEVIFKAGNVPVMVSKKYGKGRISVFCGTPAGPDVKNAFWRTGCLQEMLDKIIL
ncbi:MAG: hypothetical protein IKA22_01065 [Lentisphaeria bacterium]|nr:hypothetical protein [Lentisphaeria bacterium]